MTGSYSDMDWEKDESVVVPGQRAIAVYENVRGNIVVTEEGGNTVEIPREHILRVVEAMLKAGGLSFEAVEDIRSITTE
jgi:hypothetical protein